MNAQVLQATLKWINTMRLHVMALMLVTLRSSELHTISPKPSEASSGDPDEPLTAFRRINHLDGSYQFGYDTGPDGPQSFREEHRSADGEVVGRYGFVDTNGLLRVTEYVAGREGYRSAETIRYPVNPAKMVLYSLPRKPDQPKIGGIPVWTEDTRPLIPQALVRLQSNIERD